MRINLRKTMYITFCISTLLLLLVFYLFKDMNAKIVINYLKAYGVFMGIFIVYVVSILILEVRKTPLKTLASNTLIFLGGLVVTTALFYGLDYFFRPEKLSVLKSLGMGLNGALGTLLFKVMVNDSKMRKSE